MSPAQVVGELAAVLGAAYAAFLRARLERRTGRRGKVHTRAMVTMIEMAAEMIDGGGGDDGEALWHLAIAQLHRDRDEVETDILAHHGFVVVEHEWMAFLECLGQVRAHQLQP